VVEPISYTTHMAVVVGILLAALVLAVVIDIVAHMERPLPRDPAAVSSTTQKIIVDLTKRR
jgi:hypothetical protein